MACIFAKQKGQELALLKAALASNDVSALQSYCAPVKARLTSKRVNNLAVQQRVSALTATDGERNSVFAERIEKQHAALDLPLLPTTTIGSFPQTQAIRKARRDFKAGGYPLHNTNRKWRQKFVTRLKSKKRSILMY